VPFPDEMELIQTQKNTQKLLHQNYRFTREKYGVQGKIIWRCENRTCKARMHTLGDQVLKEPGEQSIFAYLSIRRALN
jgi:hypothetical protein